ncbi:hypothetical protein [Nocardioides yefusunii]|uniref:Uncharacterized protein n=1 Tax=Nocardioides yefusunii TaxID=2500546 RepID=A0ABW1QYC1_9ACTN|nr:hypothetical protein [Nocardioides yefusunii]
MSSEHLSTDQYADVRQALEDADRVAGDIITCVTETGALLVDANKVEFLARRLQALTRGCLEAEQRSRHTSRRENRA